MFFRFGTSVESIIKSIKPNLEAMVYTARNGIDVNIKQHFRKRTNDQNRLLWEIYSHIVSFYYDTGFIIDNLKLNFITTEFLHEYFKVRFNVKTTTNLNTKDFSSFIDKIQNEMITQTNGEYEPIIADDNYIEKTGLNLEVRND